MSLRDFIGALGRRWYVVLVCLLLTGGLTYGATVVSPPDHTARGLVLLLPSTEAVSNGGNPLLGLGGLDLPARILVAHFSSDAAQRDIADRAPDAEVTVSVDESTRGPVLAVDVLDSTPEGALEIMQYVVDEIPEHLLRIQKEVGAPTGSMVRSIPLVVDDRAQIDYGRLTRAVIAAVALGLAVTALLVFVIDGLALRRQERRLRVADDVAVVADDEPEQIGADEVPGTEQGTTAQSEPTTEEPYVATLALDGHEPAGVDSDGLEVEQLVGAEFVEAAFTRAEFADVDSPETGSPNPEPAAELIETEPDDASAVPSDTVPQAERLVAARPRGGRHLSHLQAVTTTPDATDGVDETPRASWRTP